MHALLAAAALVTGMITVEDAPLPGCTVRLTSAGYSAASLSDVAGKYRFEAVPPGDYEIEFELSGLQHERRSVTVTEETPAIVTVNLQPAATNCSMTVEACTEEKPKDRWALPACADYQLDLALIDAMKSGDRSARDLLLRRYQNAETWHEQHWLGGELLRRVSNDGAIWNDLFEHAANAVRFPMGGDDPSPEFEPWCAERELDPVVYWNMAYDALFAVSEDPRSRDLLVQALRTDDRSLLDAAIIGLASQHDESSLIFIEEALKRNPEDAGSLAQWLALFKSARADALAMKYIDESDRADYYEMREQQ